MKHPDHDKKKHMKNEVKFPEGFEVPDLDAEDEFEFVARAKKYPDGRFCIVATDGIPIEDEEKEDEEDEVEAPLGNRAKAAMAAPYA